MTQPTRDKVSARNRTQLSAKLEKNLVAYAAAATAAGVGVLASPTAAEAKIVYTPAHVQLQGDKPYHLDLNHDGKVDFFLLLKGSCGIGYCVDYVKVCHKPLYNSGTFNYVCERSTSAKSVLNQVRAVASGLAAALPTGAKIQNGDRFAGANSGFVEMGSVGFPTNTNTTFKTQWNGPWVNGGKGVKNRYLGLKFKIKDKFHFGWARLTVATQKQSFKATLTGYAYETIPGKGIIAGKTSGPDGGVAVGSARSTSAPSVVPASLGALANGAPGLSIWRRE